MHKLLQCMQKRSDVRAQTPILYRLRKMAGYNDFDASTKNPSGERPVGISIETGTPDGGPRRKLLR